MNYMRDNGPTELGMDMADRYKKESITKECGMKIKCMDKEYS